MPTPFSSCLDALTLAEISQGLRVLEEGSLAHLADCPSCRLALCEWEAKSPALLSPRVERVIMTHVKRGASKRSWLLIASAAAALLLGVLWPWVRDLRVPVLRPSGDGLARAESQRPPASFVSAHPGGCLEAASGDLSCVLGRTCSLTLRQGSRLSIPASGEIALVEGALWLEDPGESFTVRVGGARISVESATLSLERTQRRTVAWLREASASEEGEARLCVLDGFVLILREGTPSLKVLAGQEILFSSSGLRGPQPSGPLTWRGDGAWQSFLIPGRLGEGVHPLAPRDLSESYAWEALIRRVDPSAGAAVLFPAGGKGWRVLLGKPLEQEGWLRVRVEVRGGWVLLQAGSYEILRRPVTTLAQGLSPAEDGICGVRVWGGDLEVAKARWRPLVP